MKLYYEDKDITLYEGKMQEVLDTLPENSVDSVVCDPPYELTSITKRFGKENSAPAKEGKDGSFARLSKGFMGKTWDGTGVAFDIDAWSKVYKVLKPGGYLLAFGGTRTFHRMAVAIEDAGFEIRDCIMWLYGSGFPKSQNIGKQVEAYLDYGKSNSKNLRKLEQEKGTNPHIAKQPNNGMMGEMKESIRKDYTPDNEWVGWGTCLKPAYEPVIMARKPIGEDSIAKNCLKWNVGGINIDECRVGTEEIKAQISGKTSRAYQSEETTTAGGKGEDHIGRFPANVITDGSDEVAQGMPISDTPNGSITKQYKINNQVYGDYGYCNTWDAYQDSGSAMRYFYQAKASKKDRDEGLDMLESGMLRRMRPDKDDSNPTGLNTDPRWAPVERKNTHPTVKPIELMQYLVRLVSPKGSVVLDCFMGSGSTGKAVMFENRERNANYHFIGIEMTEEYLPIAKNRIIYGRDKYEYDLKKQLDEAKKETGQMNIFDILEEEN